MRDIVIHRDIPVINGYLQIQNNLEKNKTKIDFESGIADLESKIDFNTESRLRLNLGSANITKFGSIRGKDQWLRLPGITPDGQYIDKSGNTIDPSSYLLR